MGWKDLSAEQRAEVFHRFTVNKEPITDLAVEYGVYVETLSRALRKYRQQLQVSGDRQLLSRVRDSAQVREDGNIREIESNGGRITNLEELLAACAVDLSEWAVDKHIINKWEVGAKDPITGHILIEPLIQVKAWLVRVKPIEITPVVKPVYIHVTPTKPAPRKRGMKAALILPDPQFGFSRDNVHKNKLTPFHDRLALDIGLQIAEDIEPDLTIALGDINDYSGWSDKWIRRPEFYFTTQPALVEASWYLGQMRARTSGDMYALEGNHDMRPETMLATHLIEAYQLRAGDLTKAPHLLSIDNLLGLSRMGIQYIGGYPNGEVWINQFTRCIHGDKVKAGSGMTAGALVKEINATTIYGHIHRMEMAMRTIRTFDGYKTVTAFSPGCLCHIDGRVPGSKADNNWQQGLAIVWYDDENSTIEPIHIMDGRAVYNGEMYVGRDYKENLERDTEWEF